MLTLRTAVIATTMLLGCSQVGIDRRLSDLEQEEQRRQAKLDHLKVEIASTEQRISEAKAQAEYQGCLATRAKIESEIAVEKAECVKTFAERSACLAKNEARTTKGAGAGCVAGWLAAVFSGGALAPAIVIGCAGGAVLSESTKKECGEAPPKCAAVQDPSLGVMQRNSVSTMPVCRTPAVSVKPPTVASSRITVPEAPTQIDLPCRRWSIERIQFSAPAQKRGGDPWDVDGSGPDLAYTITVQGKQAYRSPKYEALVWNHSPQSSVTVLPGQSLLLELVDHDLVSADRIADFSVKIPTSVSEGPLELKSGRSTARVRFECASNP